MYICLILLAISIAINVLLLIKLAKISEPLKTGSLNYECLSCGTDLNEEETFGECCPECRCGNIENNKNWWEYKP